MQNGQYLRSGLLFCVNTAHTSAQSEHDIRCSLYILEQLVTVPADNEIPAQNTRMYKVGIPYPPYKYMHVSYRIHKSRFNFLLWKSNLEVTPESVTTAADDSLIYSCFIFSNKISLDFDDSHEMSRITF